MINTVEDIVNCYLEKFPDEKDRLSIFENYLKKNNSKSRFDWNNTNGHITVGAFVYCKREDKFLVLYHRDLKMYLYPGGHVDSSDLSLVAAAKRELIEETGLSNFTIFNDGDIPIDIDTHIIPFNERVNMPEHYHFDFRYLFFVNEVCDAVLDREECSNYKWVSSNDLLNDINYGNAVSKIKLILSKGTNNG